mgnify:CR=1 FL=1
MPAVQPRPVLTTQARLALRVLSEADVVAVHAADHVLADELMGSSYVVKGRWKASQTASYAAARVLREQTPWQLFDLSVDRGERQDLSTQHPELLADLLKARADYARRTGLVEHRRIYSGR